MHIVEVIPLGKGVTPESLSYFSPIAYERGTLLQIPVRKRHVPAIVTKVTDAFSMKAALRAATFSLRRLPEQNATRGVSEAFIGTAEYLARYHATSVNNVLYAVLPKEIREGTIPLVSSVKEDAIPVSLAPRLLVAQTEERYREYSRLVRESFATGHSIVFVVPTLEYVRQFTELLSHGIEDYTVALESSLATGTLKKRYHTIASQTHPLLVIATPQHAFIERQDLGSMILEHERSQGYHGKTRPYLDYRSALIDYAKRRGVALTLADTVPRTEELCAFGNEEDGNDIPKRLELQGELETILRIKDTTGDTPYTLLSEELEKALLDARKRKKRSFLFCARRGLAPLITCIDCGTILRDPESNAPLSLLRTTNKEGVTERWLVSSVSGYRVRATDTCPHCGSWRLRERGIGIQQVYDELIKKFPAESIILFDHQTASTPKKALALKARFESTPSAILLGTALAIPYLEKPVGLSAIVSMDSLRALPSWRQHEEIFAMLLSLREKTRGTLMVQTKIEDELLSLARRGALFEFYAEEKRSREQFNYPPFSVFVHLAWKDKDGALKKLIEAQFAPYDISLYSAFAETEAELGLQYGLIRVPHNAWPHEDIIEKIRALPPSVRVMVNPDRIL